MSVMSHYTNLLKVAHILGVALFLVVHISNAYRWKTRRACSFSRKHSQSNLNSNLFTKMSGRINVEMDQYRQNIYDVLLKLDHSVEDAEIITNTLMYAELRANNQGIIKLIAGALNKDPNQFEIKCIHKTAVSERLDGGRRIGMVVVHRAVQSAIEKAKSMGVGIVGCSNYSSATGALGHWAKEIARNNLIGIVMSQCPEMVAPHGSYEPIFGTNPIAFGIPTLPRIQVLDMATSASAWYGLAMAKENGISIPGDIAYNNVGIPTTDPAEAMKGALRVFDRSFKGSHLALMVELLAGAWTGAAMSDKANEKNWGSLVIAMDPNILGPIEDFQTNAAIMCDRVKQAKRLPSMEDQEIYLPGERGDELEAQNIQNGCIEVSQIIYTQLLDMLQK